MEEIKIKYLRDVPKLEKISKGDWVDLATGEDIWLREHEFALIPLGVAMQIPEGYEAILAPRSSTFKKYGILQANSIGVIDESYCGDTDEWMMAVYATREIHIPKGTRICQFRLFEHQPEISFTEVEVLGHEARGGFGSTGD